MARQKLNIAHERLTNTLLTGSGNRSPEQVVQLLGAVQAQDYAGAKWAVSMRSNDTSDSAIEQAFTEGRILRTHVLRPTWHFVLPEDIRWLLALTAPRVSAAMASYNRKMELTPRVFARCNNLIAKALKGGKHLTRAELRSVLERRHGAIGSAQRLGHIMMQAELDAVVCSGPRRGKQFTYALLDERAPTAMELDRDEALQRLTSRYFATRGPATVHDYAWWSGLTVADARRGIEICARQMDEVELEGRRYWMVPCGRPAAGAGRTVFLLPNYDEYFIGYRDRSAIGARVRSVDLVTGGDALIAHIVVVDGQIVGGWKRMGEGDATVLRMNMLVPLSAAERKGVAREVARFSRFMNASVTVKADG
jgi:hypothetical protein